MSIFIPSSNVKEGVFCILQMLKIHTGIHWESIDHALRLQAMNCCLKNIEFLLSGTDMQLILMGMMQSIVTD